MKVSSEKIRFLLWITAGSILLVSAVVVVVHRRRGSTTQANDPYARVPFRPKVTYDSVNVTVTNPEAEPNLDTSLMIYIEATRYTTQIGTIRPGESQSFPLRSLTNERGEIFHPGEPRTSELEVRARFKGYEVHKDFPPPP